jgi:glycolate oxidase iron-sulfur subunit
VNPEAVAGLDACVHCGFCLQSCPTYRVTDDESDSPRGRIVLMRSLASGRLSPDDPALTAHLDRCLGCRACEPVCPSGVEYGPAIEDARRVLRERRPPPLVVRVLHAMMAEPALRRPAFAVARVVRPAASALAGRGRVRMAMGMLAATARHRPDVRPLPAIAPPSPPVASEATRETVALFRGCVMDDLFAHVHDATVRVLEANGYRVIEPPEQCCCGALHAHAGQYAEAAELARRNARAFLDVPADATVVVNAAGCGAMLKGYPRLLRGGALETAGRALGQRVRDVTELLAARGPRPGAALPLRVLYDPPCHLLHAQRIAEAPERVLGSVPGIERVHHADAEMCCGSAGTYAFAEPGVANDVLALKVDAIRRAEPDVVVSGNPGCIMQIGAGLRAAGLRIPVVHPIELLDWSYERAGFYET